MPSKPKIVCLCGSTRFWKQFQKSSFEETLAGHIVLSIGAASGTDDDHFGGLPKEEYDRIKVQLDELHKRKIDLADEVLILNVGNYIGDSTRSELDYAREHDKPVRFLEPVGRCCLCGATEKEPTSDDGKLEWHDDNQNLCCDCAEYPEGA